MSSKWFDPHKSFLSLKILWLVIIGFFVLALISWLTIIANSSIDFEFGYSGFNGFVDIFRVPLGILALIIPIVALLAANHRSEQTKEQLRLTQAQNNFSNYYKHIEEFEKYCENHKNPELNILKPRQLHGFIFTNSKDGDFNIASAATQKVEQAIENILQAGEGLCSGELKTWALAINDIEKEIKQLSLCFFMSGVAAKTKNKLVVENLEFAIINGTIRNHFFHALEIFKCIDGVFKFDSSYKTSDSLLAIIDADLSKIPDADMSYLSNFKSFDLAAIVNGSINK